jgi:nucleotide-binding universal stress UspA family protein
MRTYLVVIDETPESEVALRFAARRAAKTGGDVAILALIAPTEFVAFGNIQATMEAEAYDHAEEILMRAAGTIVGEAGITPNIIIKSGDAPAMIREAIDENPDIGALVLGAAAVGAPGPLVAHFAGSDSGRFPCTVMIVPGSLSREALDRLS